MSISQVMTARAKDGFLERLSSSEFVNLSREVEAFVAEAERICGRASVSLRGSLQSQANRFVSRFHEERKTKLRYSLVSVYCKQLLIFYEVFRIDSNCISLLTPIAFCSDLILS